MDTFITLVVAAIVVVGALLAPASLAWRIRERRERREERAERRADLAERRAERAERRAERAELRRGNIHPIRLPDGSYLLSDGTIYGDIPF